MSENSDFYEVFARRYVEYYGHVDPVAAVAQWRELLNKQDLEWLPCNNPRLLDVGCGPGWHLRAWENEGFRVSGLDLSPSMLRIAAANANTGNGTDIPLYCADILDKESLGPLRGSFDQVVCHFNFLNLFGPEELPSVLAGIRSVLTSSGRCLADVYLPSVQAAPGGFVTRRWELTGTEFTERYWLHEPELLKSACAVSDLNVSDILLWKLTDNTLGSEQVLERALVVIEAAVST